MKFEQLIKPPLAGMAAVVISGTTIRISELFARCEATPMTYFFSAGCAAVITMIVVSVSEMP